MPAAEWFLWLRVLALLALALALVYWAWRALFKDRANGRRRCPRCWYNMAYTPAMTCPECGFAATRESQLAKTRPSYPQAILAILLCVGLSLWVNYQVSTNSLSSYLPTRALILSLPIAKADAQVISELRRRIISRTLSDAQLAMLLRRCARGDWSARPPGSTTEDVWIDKYGRLLDSCRRALAPTSQRTTSAGSTAAAPPAIYSPLEQLLAEIPPVVEVIMPTQWPPHVEPRLQVRLRHWWPALSEARIHLVRSDDPASPIIFHTAYASRSSRFAAVIEQINPDAGQITFDLTIEHRRRGTDQPWHVAAERQFTFPVTIEQGLTPWPEPIDSPEIQQAIRDAFSGNVRVFNSGPSPVRFRYRPHSTLIPEMQGVAVAVAIQLRRDDELARQMNIWWLGGTAERLRGNFTRPAHIGWEIAYENSQLLAELLEADDADDRWQVHVQSLPDLAMLVPDATHYWAGSFTMPLRMTRQRIAPPDFQWRRLSPIEVSNQ